MSGKLLGLMACVILFVSAILASWYSSDRSFWHQHRNEYAVNDYVPESEESGKMIRLDKNDYRLNEYLFRNLAGDLLPSAPVTFYLQKGDSVFQFQQSQEESVRDDSKYAVLVSHEDRAGSSGSQTDGQKRIKTFTDYNLLDSSNRTKSVVIDGDRESNLIRLDISRFEKSLYSYDYDSRLFGYRPQINVLCFVDYFLLYELAYSGNSTEYAALFYYDNNGKYCICSGGFPESGSRDREDDYHNLTSSAWFSMLLKSQDFTENVIREYRYQRDHLFSEEYLIGYLEGLSDFLARSELVDRNELKRQKDDLCGYLRHRLKWLDNNIESLREFSALSAVKEYRNTPY